MNENTVNNTQLTMKSLKKEKKNSRLKLVLIFPHSKKKDLKILDDCLAIQVIIFFCLRLYNQVMVVPTQICYN